MSFKMSRTSDSEIVRYSKAARVVCDMCARGLALDPEYTASTMCDNCMLRLTMDLLCADEPMAEREVSERIRALGARNEEFNGKVGEYV